MMIHWIISVTFDKESSMDFINRFDALSDEILKLQKKMYRRKASNVSN